MTWVTMLMSLAGPLVLRALTVIGLGTITFTGVTVALQGLIDIAVNNYASVPADVLGLAGVAGIPQAIGIICGAMVARVGMWVAVSATRFVLGG